jgi:hypothetical protein
MPDIENAMRLDAFLCSDNITTVMFDCYPSINLENAGKIPFKKMKWQISGMMMMCC